MRYFTLFTIIIVVSIFVYPTMLLLLSLTGTNASIFIFSFIFLFFSFSYIYTAIRYKINELIKKWIDEKEHKESLLILRDVYNKSSVIISYLFILYFIVFFISLSCPLYWFILINSIYISVSLGLLMYNIILLYAVKRI